MARTPGASGASPATIDSVLQEALSLDGGCLANQSATPAAPASGVHIYAQDNRVYTIRPNGSVNLMNGAQAGITAAGAAIDDSNTETALASYPVPAGEPQAGSVYQLYVWGTFSVFSTTTPTLSFNSYYGDIINGPEIASIPPTAAAASSSGCVFELTAVLQFYSPVTAQGLIRLNLGTDGTAMTSSSYVGAPVNPAGVTVVSSVAQGFIVSFLWGTKASGDTLQVLGGYGQRIA